MMMSSHHHKAFVFLNNVGITLLQRHKYRESVMTFQEALQFTRDNATSQQPSSSSSQQREEEESLLSMKAVHQAAERLLLSDQPQQRQSNELTLEGCHAVVDPVIVVDISNDDCFFTILQYGPSIDQVDFLIRMNENMSVSSIPCHGKIEYAILLQNLAVACKRFSDIPDDEYELSDEWRNALYEKSSSLFHQANDMISDVLTNLITNVKMRSRWCGNDPIHAILHGVMVSMFITAQMCDIMYRNDSDYEAIQYHEQFQRLYQFFLLSVQEQKRRSCMITTKQAACA